jgi:hypothetical protein
MAVYDMLVFLLCWTYCCKRPRRFGFVGAVTMNFFWQQYKKKEGLMNRSDQLDTRPKELTVSAETHNFYSSVRK